MAEIQTCVTIISHPRSGTHLLLDFIRRNFAEFQPSIPLWASANSIYLPLDSTKRGARQEWLRAQNRPWLIAQSHLLGFTKTLDEFDDVFGSRRIMLFYPFRRFSSTVKSYVEFLRHTGRIRNGGPISQLLKEKDPFFDLNMTIGECLRDHAEKCLLLQPAVIDMEQLLNAPESCAQNIGRILKMEPISIRRRIPKRKRFQGKLSEAYERLTRRESTEVQIPNKMQWRDSEEAAQIELYFKPLSEKLRAHSETASPLGL